jgi:cytochrome c-type biogenesis protein CcsB
MEQPISTVFLYIAIIGYGTALVSALILLASGKRLFSVTSLALVALAMIMHTVALLARTLELGHPPITNLHEYMTTLAWFAAFGYFFIIRTLKNDLVAAFTIAIILMLMFIAALLPGEGTKNLMPALRSYWLYIHVTAAAASEGLFAIGCVASILYFVKSYLSPKSRLREKLPQERQLDAIAHRTIVVGYVLFTLGALFAGAIWAYRAWGSFWSWDPKETSSLIVWIIYSAYLHLRINRRTEGKLPHLLSIIGFLAALATFFSSMFLGGLHSYG